MKDLLPHYESELALLRRLCRGFAEQYPGIAGDCSWPAIRAKIRTSSA